MTKENETIVILPKEKTDEFGWVISIDIEGEPIVEELPYAIQSSDRTVAIRTAKFEISKGLKVNVDRGIGEWKREGEKINAEFKITKPGRVKHYGGSLEHKSGKYRVEVDYAVADGFGGEIEAVIAGKKLKAEVKPTGGWFYKKKLKLGEVRFEKPGMYKISIEGTSVPKQLMNFYGVKLIPID